MFTNERYDTIIYIEYYFLGPREGCEGQSREPERGTAPVSGGSVDMPRTSSKASVSKSESVEAGLAECPLCLAELPLEYFPRLSTCSHRSCYDCFQQYLRIEISESRISVACPECSEPMHPNGNTEFCCNT